MLAVTRHLAWRVYYGNLVQPTCGGGHLVANRLSEEATGEAVLCPKSGCDALGDIDSR